MVAIKNKFRNLNIGLSTCSNEDTCPFGISIGLVHNMAFEDRTLGNLFDNMTPCGGCPSNRDNDEERIRIPYFANLNFKTTY